MIDTPTGPISIAADDEYLVEITLGGGPRIDSRLTGIGRDAKKQLREYLRGKRRTFDLPLLVRAPAFTARVLAEVESIPFGETRSYGDVAKAIGSPRAARAIGQAVGSNTLPIVIPCHRVLAAQRKLGGFGGGHDALDWKRYFLSLEESAWVE